MPVGRAAAQVAVETAQAVATVRAKTTAAEIALMPVGRAAAQIAVETAQAVAMAPVKITVAQIARVHVRAAALENAITPVCPTRLTERLDARTDAIMIVRLHVETAPVIACPVITGV